MARMEETNNAHIIFAGKYLEKYPVETGHGTLRRQAVMMVMYESNSESQAISNFGTSGVTE
jgi:hypothetical protein